MPGSENTWKFCEVVIVRGSSSKTIVCWDNAKGAFERFVIQGLWVCRH